MPLGSLATAVLAAGLIAAPAPGAVSPVTWCGTGVAAADRKPDTTAGRQIGVIYAFPSGGTDRFGTLASPIATDLAAIDAWWRREDPARAPRLDLAGFPNCATTAGRLDLSRVPLQQGADFYAPLGPRFQRITSELSGAPFSFSSRHKKYIVYYDGPVQEPNVCGTGGGRANEGPSFAIVYTRACFSDVGSGQLQWVAAHELVHALGAVPNGAPNTCTTSPGHVCDSQRDLMFPTTAGDPLDAATLDVGRNDYYGHSGSQFDIRDSDWLSHLDAPQFQLSVSTAGSTGTGLVESDLPGIQCPPACSIAWDAGTPVALAATTGERTRFAGWTGACSGDAACSVTMSEARSVGARFALQVRLTVQVLQQGGNGVVESAPVRIQCPGTCAADFDSGQAVALAARPSRGSRLVSWGGACSGNRSCSVTVSRDAAVSATFGRGSYRVTVRRSGSGRVVSRPAGIACGPRCAASFTYNATVRLTATPSVGWRFAGWSGVCRGARACVVKATADRAVRATFRRT